MYNIKVNTRFYTPEANSIRRRMLDSINNVLTNILGDNINIVKGENTYNYDKYDMCLIIDLFKNTVRLDYISDKLLDGIDTDKMLDDINNFTNLPIKLILTCDNDISDGLISFITNNLNSNNVEVNGKYRDSISYRTDYDCHINIIQSDTLDIVVDCLYNITDRSIAIEIYNYIDEYKKIK